MPEFVKFVESVEFAENGHELTGPFTCSWQSGVRLQWLFHFQ